MAPGLFASAAVAAASADDAEGFDDEDQRGFKVSPASLSLGGPRCRQQM